MSSELQTALAELQLNNYISLVLATAIVYDYCLVIPKEVTYIWTRPWTWVSTLFLLIRYMGCLYVITSAFGASTFIPGPVKILQGYIIDTLNSWAYTIFWIAAEMVMILRVYAMYNQSIIILRLLLVLYTTEVVILVLGVSFYSSPNHVTVAIAQLLDITVCTYVDSIQTFEIMIAIAQCTLGTVVCILVAAKFVGDSLEMYQATRTWQINRYVSLLTRDGFFYYLVTLIDVLFNILGFLGVFPPDGWVRVILAAADIAAYTLIPRFIINVRELYMLDSQGLCNRDIDTRFGLSSGVRHSVGGTTTIGTIAFAQGDAPGELEDGEEIVTVERVEGNGKQILEV